MCGIAGQVVLDAASGRVDPSVVIAMAGTLAHRGPDDSGSWSSDTAAFAFRRLSIIDVAGGHQPMRSEDGRITVVFNGEIYNHRALRRELEGHGHVFRTRSDTEVLV